ncbi:hypothetical protein D9613_009054 [Agrocybe pediades]|uniref:Uncharacterized protein n=1 Tax=Agrocybe pediades TaxID=84607 RepID=A0A8H4R2P0_9AGAR|nr:hypothetical protein D9613_009054 [Agrocybe pediades]
MKAQPGTFCKFETSAFWSQQAVERFSETKSNLASSLNIMSAPTANLLESVFDAGATPIDELVQKFNFSRVDVQDASKNDYLVVHLAPSYVDDGHAGKVSLAKLDDNVKIMITGTLKTLSKLEPSERSYDSVLGSLTRNPLMETVASSEIIKRADKILKDDTHFMKVDWKVPDASAIAKVQEWFNSVIDDKETVAASGVTGKVLKDVVALSSHFIKESSIFEGLSEVIETPVKKEKFEKTILDITFLHFPTEKSPVFKLNHIIIHEWTQYEKIALLEQQTTGITCDYVSREFKPRTTTLDALKLETREGAIKQAEELFN